MPTIKISTTQRIIYFVLLPLISGITLLNGKSLVLPVEAIEDTGKLSAEEFSKRHAGIDVSGYYPDDPGYYIAYTHENLTYYFGPLEEYIEAIQWKDKLSAIREDVIYERPSLGSSEIVIYNFTLETIEEHGRNMQNAAGSDGSTDGESGQMAGMPGQEGSEGQESGILIPEGGQQQGQTGSQQGQQGSQAGGQQNQQGGVQVMQLPSGQQGQQSGQSTSSQRSSSSSGNPSSSSSSSNSSSSSSSSSNSSSSSSGGGSGQPSSPSWWEIIKGIFGG